MGERNDTARGIYGEAMRAKQELAAASNEQLEAALLDMRAGRPGSCGDGLVDGAALKRRFTREKAVRDVWRIAGRQAN
jgi:hypothetical protein